MDAPAGLERKHELIEHLATTLRRLEKTMTPWNAVRYRMCFKLLRRNLAGYPPAQLHANFYFRLPEVQSALENLHFDTYGFFAGQREGKALQDALFARMGTKPTTRQVLLPCWLT